MVLWRKTHRQWKRSAEEAIAPVRFPNERDRLAARVAKDIWVMNGGKAWADARGEGALLLLETLVLRHLTDEVVRASLAIYYLDLLESAADRAEYEDARALVEEQRWAEKFLDEFLQCALWSEVVGRQSGERQAASRLADLQAAVASLVQADLLTVGIAA